VTKRLRQRGSALLASLMVIVGLSLLGLAFVAISETESAISINERNHTETVALAESGAREVVQWFQYPDDQLRLGLMPVNNATNAVFKITRDIGTYTGVYSPAGPPNSAIFPSDPLRMTSSSASRERRRHHRSDDSRRTGVPRYVQHEASTGRGGHHRRTSGRRDHHDQDLCAADGWIESDALPTGTFDVGGTRYGVATILARAEKFDQPSTVATRRSIALAECRIVVSQFPLPTPGGPLQSATSLATNGNFNVHWGLVSGQTSLNLQKDYTTTPWVNAYERIHFNRGYDSSILWATNTAYRHGDIVRPTAAAIAGNPLLRFHEYTVTVAGNSGLTEPTWLPPLPASPLPSTA
jgi:hypothetical protein